MRWADFTVRTAPSGVGDMILDCLQDDGALDLGDFLMFRIGEATMDLDGAPYGGARYPVEATMAGRTFVKFHLDVGNSRFRDLVDLALLVRSGILDDARVVEAIRRTFARRGTYAVPQILTEPPEGWSAPFAALAEECPLGSSAGAAFEEVARYFGRLELGG